MTKDDNVCIRNLDKFILSMYVENNNDNDHDNKLFVSGFWRF